MSSIILTSILDALRLHADQVIEFSTNIVNDHIHRRQVGTQSNVNHIKARQQAVGTIGDALHFNECSQK